MDGDKMSHFGGKEDEISHWKNLAAHYKEKVDQCEMDFGDFQENSQMLERELETQIDQLEKRERDLLLLNSKLQNDLLKSRDNQVQADTRIIQLETKLLEYQSTEEKMFKYIRDLEQKNDDLERSQRALQMSLGENEAKLNTAIERNAFLESEQDEAGATVQRLKDETRDLLQEMKVRVPDNDKSLRSLMDSNKQTEMETQSVNTQPSSPLIKCNANELLRTQLLVGGPLTAPTRISAMNMVGDLLRKVGALESKLASCRNASRDSPLPGDSPVNTQAYRGRRISRGNGSPAIHGYLRA